MSALLRVENLSVDYLGRRPVRAVRGVTLELQPGETLGVVGESGSGKSTLALSILKLIPEGQGKIAGGKIFFDGVDILSLPPAELRKRRGGAVGMVFQDPFSALNPVLTIGEQLEEVLEVHGGRRDKTRALELLRKVRLPDPERIYGSFPHQVSGGQRQRACMAMAIAAGPKLLIADEPTTALDATVQKELLDLLDQLQADLGMAILFITHNMGLLAERADRVAVMYAGEIIETGETKALLSKPLHPYTQGLLASLPRVSRTGARLPSLPGQPPDPAQRPAGCAFHPRCPKVFASCRDKQPVLKPADERSVACHLYP